MATLPEEEPTLHPVGRQTQGQTSQVWQTLKVSEADVPGGIHSTFPGNPGWKISKRLTEGQLRYQPVALTVSCIRL